ncbi:hypothetical protein CEXT_482531 [Caerostris extrusa]|uniref:Uncharacterized protein n=1 Tax=Caerostris extrusa TaxID=172846 RepID=A0AAV4MKE7_CAEEX|nr:hypothetical protein CEXT_482531 [Caerostris extrusa]
MSVVNAFSGISRRTRKIKPSHLSLPVNNQSTVVDGSIKAGYSRPHRNLIRRLRIRKRNEINHPLRQGIPSVTFPEPSFLSSSLFLLR